MGFRSQPEPPSFNIELPKADVASVNVAQLREIIEDFERQIDAGMCVGMRIHDEVMVIREITCRNPALVIIDGTINGERARVVQHISRISITMVAVTAQDEPRAIGFHVA